MPYQCSLCKRFSSEILIVQCASQQPELNSCNSSICLQCSIEFYEFLLNNEQNGHQNPIEECGFCNHSLVLKEIGGEDSGKLATTGQSKMAPRHS